MWKASRSSSYDMQRNPSTFGSCNPNLTRHLYVWVSSVFHPASEYLHYFTLLFGGNLYDGESVVTRIGWVDVMEVLVFQGPEVYGCFSKLSFDQLTSRSTLSSLKHRCLVGSWLRPQGQSLQSSNVPGSCRVPGWVNLKCCKNFDLFDYSIFPNISKMCW